MKPPAPALWMMCLLLICGGAQALTQAEVMAGAGPSPASRWQAARAQAAQLGGAAPAVSPTAER